MLISALSKRELEEIQERINRSSDPIVVLRMPHCEPVMVNAAMDRIHPLGLHVPESDQSAAANPARAALCFCKEMETSLAFRPQDCAHESNFEDFCEDPHQEPLAGFEFYLLESSIAEGSKPSTRTYSTARIHSALLSLWSSGNTFNALMEVRILISSRIRLRIVNLDQSTLGARLKIAPSDTAIFDSSLTIDRAALPAYHAMELAMQESLREPARATSILLTALEAIKTADPARRVYPSCSVVVREILSDPNGVANDAAAIQAKIERVLEKLYDGPVVVQFARRALERFLSTRVNEILLGLDQETLTDLARLKAPLQSLVDAESGFLGRNPAAVLLGS